MANVDLEYINKLTPKNMADLTDSKKLLTLHNLAAYNHKLISQLGLTNDTALYDNATVAGTDYAVTDAQGNLLETYTKPTNVKLALDQLYELVAAGTGIKSIASGYIENAQGEEVVFTKDSTATDSENYYINFTDATGKVTNIKLDASSFVKDGVLADAKIVWASAASDFADWTVTDEKTVIELPTGTYDTKDAATTAGVTDPKAYMLFYIKNTTDTDPVTEGTFYYTTMHLATDELLGDLVGGPGISFDGGKISADIATQGDTKLVKLVLTGDSVTDASQLDITIIGAEDSTSYSKTATGAKITDLEIHTPTTNGVIDNNELKNALTDVKNYIDDRDAANSVDIIDGACVTTDPQGTDATEGDGIYVTSAVDATSGKTTFTVGAVVATDDEIDAIFA